MYVEIFASDLMPLDFGFLLISFKKLFFPKFELLNSGCGLSVGASTDAAYLQVFMVSVFLKKKKKLSLIKG